MKYFKYWHGIYKITAAVGLSFTWAGLMVAMANLINPDVAWHGWQRMVFGTVCFFLLQLVMTTYSARAIVRYGSTQLEHHAFPQCKNKKD